MEGKGIYKWEDGTTFKGEFSKNQKKNGQLMLPNGEIFQN